MFDLRPCNACRRHVASIESACPFCGTAREPAEPRYLTFRRVSRAAVFAGAALVSISCGGKKPKTETAETTETSDSPPPMQADAGVSTPATKTEPDPLDRYDPTDPYGPREPKDIRAPYGAPPARRRVV